MSTYERIVNELEAWPKAEGVKIGDLMQLSDPLRAALNNLMRDGAMSLERLSAELGLELGPTIDVANMLLDRGFLKVGESDDGGVEYRLWHAQAHKREKPLTTWTVILEDIDVLEELKKLQQQQAAEKTEDA